MGSHRRPLDASGFRDVVEVSGGCLAVFSVSLEKIFGFFKNFVCICGKMGYNREYENL